jgi:hypothetical protein
MNGEPIYYVGKEQNLYQRVGLNQGNIVMGGVMRQLKKKAVRYRMEEITKTIKLYIFITSTQIIIGKMGEKDEDGNITVNDPALIVPTQRGDLSYVAPIGMMDKKLEQIHIRELICYYEINRPDMIQSYIKHVTNLIIAT